MLVLTTAGCAAITSQYNRLEAISQLNAADQLQRAGRFSQAMGQLQAVCERSADKPPADRALYRIGVLLLHPVNPNQDPAEALATFRQLCRSFPDSPYADTAGVWIGVLHQLQQAWRREARSRKQLAEAQEQLCRLRRDIRSLEQQFEAFKRIDLESSTRRMLPDVDRKELEAGD
jgi:hypothetical protein